MKLEIFDLKMTIEDCNILKIEEDAEEVKEEHDAMDLNQDETMEENVANLTENLAGEINLVIDEILKEKIKLTGDKINALKGSDDSDSANGGSSGAANSPSSDIPDGE